MTPSLQIVAVELRVPDLARSVDYYGRGLGFAVTQRTDRTAEFATAPGAPALLRLTEDRDAAPSPRDAAGLFHAALLFPRRAELGRWLRFAAAQQIPFDGFSDHGVSEALYFTDPDGNGLEFYADRAREQWPLENGRLAMTTTALDVDALLAAGKNLAANAAPLANARWGHLHFRVTDLARSEAFYREQLGLAVTQDSLPGARFMAVDGYHHHLGLNTWGHPRQPQPAGALGLAAASLVRAGIHAPTTLRDPDGIALDVRGV